VALLVSLVTFVASLQLTFVSFEPSYLGPFELNVDGLSLPFFLLTTFSRPIFFLAGWSQTSRAYLACFLVLESLLLILFSVKDLLSFYVFFEAVLVPLFLIVGRWGAEGRVRASYLLFLYTLFGSLPMLLSILYIGVVAGTFSFDLLALVDIEPQAQLIPWLGFFLALAIKTPLRPFTRWLHSAHARAPVAGSRVLAGIILKLAVYGFLRVLLPVLPEASQYFSPLVQTICVITLIYASACTIRQVDRKILVAYSSICHRAVGLAGIFSNTLIGLQGAVLVSLAHGFVSPALFYIVGRILYDRFHTRTMRYYRGLARYMPLGMTFFFLFAMSTVGTPTSLNWVGEFLTLAGSLQRAPLITIGLATSIVTSAAYSFYRFVRIAFGSYSPSLSWTSDLSRREFMVLIPLMIPTFVFGLYPDPILEAITPALQALLVA